MAAFIICMTAVVIFLPYFNFSTIVQDYLVHILFILLISGMMGLIINNRIIMFTSFGCAAALALFLKSASNSEFKNPKENQNIKLSVAHVNLSVISDIKDVENLIWNDSLDVVSFQEYTPDWAELLPELVSTIFPYKIESIRIDLYGKALYSKYPISEIKKINQEELNDLEINITKSGQDFKLISIYAIPALDKLSKKQANAHFAELKNYILEHKFNHLIFLGELNQVYWSHDIIEFRNTTKLLNSRRNVFPTTQKVPYDHIFFSPDLQCYQFEELIDMEGFHIGCKAAFQYKTDPFINKFR